MKFSIQPKILFVAFLSITLFSSCAKLKHLDQLLTLNDMAKEAERMDQYVEKRDQQFRELLEVVKSGDIKDYSTQKSILRKFGEPILDRNVEHNGKTVQMYMYRYQMEKFGAEKIYLYFDDKKLIEWEHYVPEKKDTET